MTAPHSAERDHLAWMIYCWNEGYRTPEDRAILKNWISDPDDQLHPDDIATRDALRVMADGILETLDWQPTRWWRAIDPDGRLWAESSNEAEIRARARPNDTVQRLWERVDRVWRDAESG